MMEVMNYMKSKDYDDAKDYAGECEPIVIIAKGQSMYLTTQLFVFEFNLCSNLKLFLVLKTFAVIITY
jgi:hypothetical protein